MVVCRDGCFLCAPSAKIKQACALQAVGLCAGSIWFHWRISYTSGPYCGLGTLKLPTVALSPQVTDLNACCHSLALVCSEVVPSSVNSHLHLLWPLCSPRLRSSGFHLNLQFSF